MGVALRNGEQKEERGACLACFRSWVRKDENPVPSRHLPGLVPRKHSTASEINTKETLVKKVLCGPCVRSWVLESELHISPLQQQASLIPCSYSETQARAEAGESLVRVYRKANLAYAATDNKRPCRTR